MGGENLQAKVRGIFEQVLEKTPGDRLAYIETMCANDSSLRYQVLRLVEEFDRADDELPPAVNVPRPLDHPRLQADDLLGGKFRVIRYIDEGGMGEVYEGYDLHLNKRVALKTLRPQLVDNPLALKRLKHEVLLAREIACENVCRVYTLDIFPLPGQQKQIAIVSMEFLEGESLAQRLRSGLMSIPEALPLIMQMGTALAAAHKHKIIHRDFKPENVMLVGQGRGTRAVVTDFGLSFRLPNPNPSQSASRTSWAGLSLDDKSHLLGTIAYMAPEQLRDRPATERSDIYALGLVMFEMITGKRPIASDNPFMIAIERQNKDAPSPRSLVPGLESQWNAVILRCLDRDPEQRFASVGDVVQALSSEQTTHSDRSAVFRRQALQSASAHITQTDNRIGASSSKEKIRLPIVIALAMLVFVVTGILYYRSRHSSPLTKKDSIVLADFVNKTSDTVLNDALKEGLAVELEQSPILNILAEKRISEQLQYMGRPAETSLTPEVAREVCLRAGSKALLVGSVSQIGNHYVIGLKATDCQNDETIGNEQVEVDSRELVLTKLHEVGRKMRFRLGETLASVQRFDVPLPEATTSSLEALQAYARAAKALTVGGDSAAVPLYKHAIDLDPNFAAAYADLAVVYANLNEFSLSAGNAQKAYELRTRSTERERFVIDATYYKYATGELEKAAQVYELWKQTYPQDLTPYIQISLIDSSLGRLESALHNDQEGLKLARNAIVYTNLAYDYTSLNRLDEAAAILSEAKDSGIKDSFLQNYYQLAFLRDNAKEMQRCAADAVGQAGDEDALLAMQADTNAFHGKLSEARRLSRQAIKSALGSDAREVAAGWQATAALREAEFGNAKEAEREASAALDLASSRNLDISVALALARAGNLTRERYRLQRLATTLRPDTMVSAYWLPAINAAIALREKEPRQALQDLEPTDFHELGGSPPPFTAGATMYPNYLRGQAYLALGQWDKAAAEYKKIIDHPGLVWNFPFGALSYLQLGRAYAGSGNPAARAAYEKFLSLWHDADSDLPLLREAKREYSSLK
jgi:serine/threonine protein kinase/tetratricopeptide (TPR) repeat protein